MSVMDDPKTLGRARLSFADQHDIDDSSPRVDLAEETEFHPEIQEGECSA